MTCRTPSSLKWLIDKRSRLAGRQNWAADRIQRLRFKLQQLEEDLGTTTKRLQAIDVAIRIHEIPVDPEGLSSIRPTENKWLLPHGHLGRILLRELRIRDTWVDTRDLANVLLDHLSAIGQPNDFAYVMQVVRNRLNGLYHRGTVIRHIQLDYKGHTDGMTLALWSLPGREAPNQFGKRITPPGTPKAENRPK